MFWETKWTDPSALRTFTPPACRLREAAVSSLTLPPVHGNRDLLIQVFLNLVKNAAEAAPAQGGEIILSTAFQHGVRLAVAGSDSRVHLPLVVSVTDNAIYKISRRP